MRSLSHSAGARQTSVALRTIWRARSFDALADQADRLGAADLPPGSPFVVELDLNAPVAGAFDVFLAEHIFRPVVPPWLELVDVHSEGSRTVVVEMRVPPAGEAGQGEARMGAVIALGAIAAFIASNWVGLSLATIGVSVALGFLVSSIRGKMPSGFPDFGDIKTILLVGVGVVVLANASQLIPRGRR